MFSATTTGFMELALLLLASVSVPRNIAFMALVYLIDFAVFKIS